MKCAFCLKDTIGLNRNKLPKRFCNMKCYRKYLFERTTVHPFNWRKLS